MPQQCERPACAEPAVVAYGFDPSRAMAWLEPYVAGGTGLGAHQGGLCRRHADAMVVPQGWWLEDRRSAEQLFVAKPVPHERAVRRPPRPSGAMAEVVPLALLAPEPAAPPVDDAAAGAVAEDAVTVDDTAPTPAWTPTFVVDDDLDGLLNATSPLLGRAFGRVKGSGTRQRAPGA